MDNSRWMMDVKNNPPEPGYYLCYRTASIKNLPGYFDVCKFTDNLELVDEDDFAGENHPGWYGYDHEYGYYTIDDITHWMYLPDSPENN